MKSPHQAVRGMLAVTGALFWAACGPSATDHVSSAQRQAELERLRSDQREVKRLRAENQELARLRKDNEEIRKLRGFESELSLLRKENEQMRQALAALPNPPLAPPPAPQPATNRLEQIRDLVGAFQEAAFMVASHVTNRPEDVPMEGDNILIDQSVIGLLIAEFQDRTNGGPYEVSGWLKSKGVVITNYQQLHYVGLTNFQIRRAAAPPQDPPPK
ncbi:MAG: hypothetical protein HY735_04580 [Verrucomicrobia bacterium]|nr:hypothetical protein [Verrucomicrobiota bacterium]